MDVIEVIKEEDGQVQADHSAGGGLSLECRDCLSGIADFYLFWYHLSPDLLKIFKSFFRTLWRTYLNIWVFLLYRHMPAKQALSSYILPKGMKEIIQESLRRSGYFNYVNIFQVLEWQYGIVELLK